MHFICYNIFTCGSGSVVERHLAKVNVASSNLVFRSIFRQAFRLAVFVFRFYRCIIPTPADRAFYKMSPYSRNRKRSFRQSHLIAHAEISKEPQKLLLQLLFFNIPYAPIQKFCFSAQNMPPADSRYFRPSFL